MISLAKYVFDEISASPYFEKISNKLIQSYSSNLIDNKKEFILTDREKNDLFRFIDLLSNSEIQEARMKAYHLISLLDIFMNQDEKFIIYASAVYSKLGLYALNFESEKLPFDRKIELISKKFNQTVDEDFVLTDVQYEIYNKMVKSPHFSFSGPTSLGKSFIIRRYIKSIIRESRSNIVIVVPSRALINQYVNDIKFELGESIKDNKYLVLTSGNIGETEKKDKYIFILTPERLLSLYARNKKISIDFIFVDEAHKLSSSSNTDIRSLTAYSAIDKTLKNNPSTKLVFASPNIANPEIFLELFNKEKVYSIKVEEAPVSQNLYLVDFKYNDISYFLDSNKIKINTNIFNTVRSTNQFIYKIGKHNSSNLIYCSSKYKAINSALEFFEVLETRDICISEKLEEAISKISSFIHKDYYLSKFLKRRIAYHHGQLPQIVRNIVEKLFREGEINFIFCTPTLVEGVNMPTRNIFINCDYKIRLGGEKINYPNKTIAFWNLAGRAGRYRKELSGNIFCIQHDNKFRWDNLSIFDKSENNLLTSIDKKIYDKKSVEKLKNSMLNQNKSLDNKDKVENYLSNLLSIDAISYKDDINQSFILKKLLDHNHYDVFKVAKKNSNIISDVPMDVLESFQSLDFNIQVDVYRLLSQNPESHKLPKLNYENILKILTKFYNLYKWNKYEKSDIKSLDQLRYYSLIMNKWVSGESLNSIIEEELRNKKEIQFSVNVPVIAFDKNDLTHVNHVIDGLISTIEKVITFIFEKYFNHYHKILSTLLGEDKAGHNWSTYLEYGTQNQIEIGLQNFGLSRHTSHTIVKTPQLLRCISIDDISGEVRDIDKISLLHNINKDSLEYDEISSML